MFLAWTMVGIFLKKKNAIDDGQKPDGMSTDIDGGNAQVQMDLGEKQEIVEKIINAQRMGVRTLIEKNALDEAFVPAPGRMV